MRFVAHQYRRLVTLVGLPLILGAYYDRAVGRDYRVGIREKTRLLLQMWRNTRRITSASHFAEHVVMATAVLRIPRAAQGDFVECGTFKGSSAATLSLLARLEQRRLWICDSFEGLPEPGDVDREHLIPGTQERHTYEKGAFSGALEEVRANIDQYGAAEVCEYVKGYFDDTLPGWDKDLVFVFVDVDLRESLYPCVQYLWPRLQPGCNYFTHEAQHLEIASLFYDAAWWREHVDAEEDPPGLVGAGSGLGLIPTNLYFGSSLGFAVKGHRILSYEHLPQVGPRP